MTEISQALDLITKYGLGLVLTVVLAVVVIWLFKRYDSSWEARLKDEQDRTAYVEKLRIEERESRVAGESRLASNAEALRDAAAAFVSAQRFMETLINERTADRSEARQARR